MPVPAALTALAAGLTAGLAAADPITGTCRFETECFEAEACDAAAFSLRIDGGALGEDAEVSEAQTFALQDGGTVSFGQSEATAQILTVGPGGAARYTLHLTDGPAVVTYHGQCEAE